MDSISILIVSREFGFTFGLSDAKLKKVLDAVNKKRYKEKYLNDKAPTIAQSTVNKIQLTNNLFCRDFNYGKNRSRHWDGNHTSTQLEDYVDFLFTLNSSNHCDLVFALDYVQAHERHAENAQIIKKLI